MLTKTSINKGFEGNITLEKQCCSMWVYVALCGQNVVQM